MMNSLEIKPGIGLSNLNFGITMVDTELIIGKPDEIELLNEIEGCGSTVWHYWKHQFALFFNDQNKLKLNSAEINNVNATLWENAVFKLNKNEIIHLFKNKGIVNYELEQEEWGEQRLTFDEVNIDFYFEKNKLAAINLSESMYE